jgi:hypothetical protein
MPATAGSQLPAQAPSRAPFTALASTQCNIIASQRLRYPLFSEEMGGHWRHFLREPVLVS